MGLVSTTATPALSAMAEPFTSGRALTRMISCSGSFSRSRSVSPMPSMSGITTSVKMRSKEPLWACSRAWAAFSAVKTE